MYEACPRLVIAGTGGDSGKTLVSLGLLAGWRAIGLRPAAFKKGPDYIDAAWLSLVAARPARNLDTYLAGFDATRASFFGHAAAAEVDVALVEGNRGLHDGLDSHGTHSTAELAKAIAAPVVLVVGIAKVTRTAAAVVLGCQQLDPEVRIGGVILNRVAGGRHERVARQAIEELCGVPVLGAIPRLADEDLLPGRHLGLVTPAEVPRREVMLRRVQALVGEHVDLERLTALARSAPAAALEPALAPAATTGGEPAATAGRRERARIGVLCDSAFSFYYPENLEALEAAGAELVQFSALADAALPEVDALYLGGGFPETHASALAANRSLLARLRAAAEDGMPIYAECGGLMLLARALAWQGREYPLAGVLPIRVEVTPTPQGHGYCEARVDGENPFFAAGTMLRGHEFHYSRVLPIESPAEGVGVGDEQAAPLGSVYAMRRGNGALGGRDGLLCGNVLATYVHLFAPGCPEWAAGLVRAAERFGGQRAHQAHGNSVPVRGGDARGRFASTSKEGHQP